MNVLVLMFWVVELEVLGGLFLHNRSIWKSNNGKNGECLFLT